MIYKPAFFGPNSGHLFYTAIVTRNTRFIKSLNCNAAQRKGLKSGMQVVAEIHRGRRTIMEYLLSPVQKVTSEAGRER